jgi:hypothetical protein
LINVTDKDKTTKKLIDMINKDVKNWVNRQKAQEQGAEK